MTRACSTEGCRRTPDADWAVCRVHAEELLVPRLPRSYVRRTSEDFVPEWRRRSLARDMTEPVR